MRRRLITLFGSALLLASITNPAHAARAAQLVPDTDEPTLVPNACYDIAHGGLNGLDQEGTDELHEEFTKGPDGTTDLPASPLTPETVYWTYTYTGDAHVFMTLHLAAPSCRGAVYTWTFSSKDATPLGFALTGPSGATATPSADGTTETVTFKGDGKTQDIEFSGTLPETYASSTGRKESDHVTYNGPPAEFPHDPNPHGSVCIENVRVSAADKNGTVWDIGPNEGPGEICSGTPSGSFY